ncbi:MAG: penicillin-insensitive murein endopeptidase, partial [Deltaproteobacteria bacterium]|nr:penicillin-insensitive murein endopeptidase [Deltaproteobacteria bacterium]
MAFILILAGCGARQTAIREPEPVVEEVSSPEPVVTIEYKFPAPKIPEGYATKTFLSPEGEKVTLMFKKDSYAEGLPTKGRLVNGVKLPPKGIGYIHLSSASWGTDELIKILQYCLNRVVERYPGTADVVIGALSKEGGGRLKPHKSHRNGLDIDI